jgi:hypothetical protein
MVLAFSQSQSGLPSFAINTPFGKPQPKTPGMAPSTLSATTTPAPMFSVFEDGPDAPSIVTARAEFSRAEFSRADVMATAAEEPADAVLGAKRPGAWAVWNDDAMAPMAPNTMAASTAAAAVTTEHGAAPAVKKRALGPLSVHF